MAPFSVPTGNSQPGLRASLRFNDVAADRLSAEAGVPSLIRRLPQPNSRFLWISEPDLPWLFKPFMNPRVSLRQLRYYPSLLLCCSGSEGSLDLLRRFGAFDVALDLLRCGV